MAKMFKFPRFEKVAPNLWIMKLSDSPKAQAQADKLVEELRANNYIVPEHLKGD